MLLLSLYCSRAFGVLLLFLWLSCPFTVVVSFAVVKHCWTYFSDEFGFLKIR